MRVQARYSALAAGMLVLIAASSGVHTDHAPARSVTAEAPDSCPPSAGLPRGAVADHGSAAAKGPELSLDAGDSYFHPTCGTNVPAGQVTLHVKNTGRMLHNVSFPDQAIDQDIAPGDSATLTVKMGTDPLRFVCKYHSAAGMVGALVGR
jgi:plastocyanin